MRCVAIAQTALDTKNTPWSFGVVALNASAAAITLEGSDTSSTAGFTDIVVVPITGAAEANSGGRLPRWVRAKTAGTLYLLGN